MAILLSNIKLLVNTRADNAPVRGKELHRLPCIPNGFVVVEGDRIAAVGSMDDLKEQPEYFNDHHDLGGKMLLPSWCDSHTHAVFVGSREGEFVDKIKGLSYADIAAKGGGILNSAKKLNDTSEDVLFHESFERILQLIKLGTGAIEIKSGYGLSVEGELKMLRVIQRLKAALPIPVKATFLAAHSFPAQYKEDHEAYIRLIIDEMLPQVGKEGLADFIDVFCEDGFFSVEEMESICRAGRDYGLQPKLHVNQLNSIGGIAAGVRQQAVSLDHLEVMTDEDVQTISTSSTVATLLPTAAFFLHMPMQPARQLIDSHAIVALASDYNPGSSPSGNMNFVVALSCIQMRMLPEEAINAATINGACAMNLQDDVGSIAVGKKANFIITKPIPSLAYLPYSFGTHHIETVMINGEIF